MTNRAFIPIARISCPEGSIVGNSILLKGWTPTSILGWRWHANHTLGSKQKSLRNGRKIICSLPSWHIGTVPCRRLSFILWRNSRPNTTFTGTLSHKSPTSSLRVGWAIGRKECRRKISAPWRSFTMKHATTSLLIPTSSKKSTRKLLSPWSIVKWAAELSIGILIWESWMSRRNVCLTSRAKKTYPKQWKLWWSSRNKQEYKRKFNSCDNTD